MSLNSYLIYVSSAVKPMSEAEILEMLVPARIKKMAIYELQVDEHIAA